MQANPCVTEARPLYKLEVVSAVSASYNETLCALMIVLCKTLQSSTISGSCSVPCMPPEAESVALAEGPLNEDEGLPGVPEALFRGLPEVLDRACSKAVVPKRGPAGSAEGPAAPPVPADAAEGLLIPVGEPEAGLRVEAC